MRHRQVSVTGRRHCTAGWAERWRAHVSDGAVLVPLDGWHQCTTPQMPPESKASNQRHWGWAPRTGAIHEAAERWRRTQVSQHFYRYIYIYYLFMLNCFPCIVANGTWLGTFGILVISPGTSGNREGWRCTGCVGGKAWLNQPDMVLYFSYPSLWGECAVWCHCGEGWLHEPQRERGGRGDPSPVIKNLTS